MNKLFLLILLTVIILSGILPSSIITTTNPGTNSDNAYSTTKRGLDYLQLKSMDQNATRSTTTAQQRYKVFTNMISTSSISNIDSLSTELTQNQFSYARTLSDYEGTLRIGIIDNGILDNHEAFDTIDIIQKNFNVSSPAGDMSHGTMVASAIAGQSNSNTLGLATNATIYSARMGTPVDTPSAVEGDFIAAFRWLLVQNVSIINISLSGSAIPFQELLEEADARNILVVGSAGNFGNYYTSNSGISQYPSTFSLGSIDSDRKLSYFSSFGYGEYYNDKIDFVHLGQEVVTASSSSVSSYSYGSGTSFAAPLFTGALALLVEFLQDHDMEYSSSKIKALLATSALKPSNGRRLEMGYGLVNFSKAIELVQKEGFVQLATLDTTIPYGVRSNHLRGSTDIVPISVFAGLPLVDLSYQMYGNISKLVNLTINNTQVSLVINSNETTDVGVYSGTLNITYGKYTIQKSIQVTVTTDKKYEVLLHLGYTTSHYDFINRLDGHNLKAWSGLLWNRGYHITESFERFSEINLNNFDLIVLPDFLSKSYENDYYGRSRVISNSTFGQLDEYMKSGGHVIIQTYGNVVDHTGLPNSYASSKSLNNYLSNHGLNISQPVKFQNNISDPYTSILPQSPLPAQVAHVSDKIEPTTIRHMGGYIEYNRNNPEFTAIASLATTSAKEIYNTIVSKRFTNGSLTISTSDYFMDSCRVASDRSSFIHTLIGCESDSLVLSEVAQHREFNLDLLEFLISNRISIDTLDISLSSLSVNSSQTYTFELRQEGNLIYSHLGNSWHLNNLQDGEYGLYVYHNDSYIRYPITIDTRGPDVEINSLEFLYVSRDNLSSYIILTITDQAYDYSVIYVNSTKLMDTTETEVIIETTELGKGYFNITIHSFDLYGNSKVTSYMVKIFELNSVEDPIDTVSSSSLTKSRSMSSLTETSIRESTESKSTYMIVVLLISWTFAIYTRRRYR